MLAALPLGLSPHVLKIPAQLNLLAPVVVDGLIRVGKVHDGGYVIPAFTMQEADFLISLGISDDWSFEEHFQRLNRKVQIHAYDHTISKNLFRASILRGFVKMLFRKTSREDFARRYNLLVSYKNFFAGQSHHFRERINDELSLPYDVTLEKVFQRADSNKLFLKIDIEGSEYKIIDEIVKHSAQVVGMAIEFHQTGVSRQAFLQAMMSLQQHFEVVHLHANNFDSIGADNLPEALEITFVRKSQCESSNKRDSLPMPLLDSPNDPNHPDYQIHFASQ